MASDMEAENHACFGEWFFKTLFATETESNTAIDAPRLPAVPRPRAGDAQFFRKVLVVPGRLRPRLWSHVFFALARKI